MPLLIPKCNSLNLLIRLPNSNNLTKNYPINNPNLSSSYSYYLILNNNWGTQKFNWRNWWYKSNILTPPISLLIYWTLRMNNLYKHYFLFNSNHLFLLLYFSHSSNYASFNVKKHFFQYPTILYI